MPHILTTRVPALEDSQRNNISNTQLRQTAVNIHGLGNG